MSEDQQNLKRGLNRAAAGLGIVAIGWAIAVLFGHREDDSPIVWAIPVVAALFGLALYSQARQIGSSQE
ncbi:MAG: hypothetical protein ACKOB4_07845 [Acidobacteriota bacterium]